MLFSVEVASRSVELDHSVEACLLGRLYVRGSEKRRQGRHQPEEDSHPPHVVDLLTDCHSIIWMTYRWAGPSVGGATVRCRLLTHAHCPLLRSSFSAIPGTVMTTDCGWGCMVRSGQMILANALNIHLLGRGGPHWLTWSHDWHVTHLRPCFRLAVGGGLP